MIDFGRGTIVPFPELVDEMIELIEEDAGVLRCLREVENARAIAIEGTSSQRQRAAAAGAKDHDSAMRAVVSQLIEEFHADL